MKRLFWIILLTTSCSKEEPENWEKKNEFSGSGCKGVTDRYDNCDCDCENFTPWVSLSGGQCGIELYFARFELRPFGQSTYLNLVLPEDNPYFYFVDQQIADSLDFFVSNWKFCVIREFSGYIKGEKNNQDWKITYDLSFSHRKNKFRIVNE